MPAARRPGGRGGARPSERRPRAGRPSRPPPTRRQSSDLFSRILVAVPAAVVAIAFIDLGGIAWALFMLVIGCACLHELYRLLARWRPVPLVGFAALAGMVLAARYGGQRQVVEVAMGAVPLLFGRAGRPQHGGATVAIAGTLLGYHWIGLAFAHAVCAPASSRQRDHHRRARRHVPRRYRRISRGSCSAAARSLPRSLQTRRSRDCCAGC